MKGSLQAIVFAAVLGVVCAGLLTGAHVLLKDRQDANAEAERLRNIFLVLDVPFREDDDAAQLVKLAKDTVTEHEVDGLKYYQYEHPDQGTLRAFEFAGPGLWAPIKGLLCLRGDLVKVYAVSFYKHEETPGLGGEIDTPAFRGQFVGKRIEKDLRIAAGAGAEDNGISAISGATMTSDKVQAMLNEAIAKIRERKGKILREVSHGG